MAYSHYFLHICSINIHFLKFIIMKKKLLLLGTFSLLATATIHAQEFRLQPTPQNIFHRMTPSAFPCNTNCCPETL